MTTLQALGLANRKAKVDLYYSPHASLVAIADYQAIRAPFKQSWQRDLLRVKGGITDYCVIGEIDVQALRQFQSSHRSPAKPFKPVPDGFEIDSGRKVLPAGDKE